jgi:hypothetical protein
VISKVGRVPLVDIQRRKARQNSKISPKGKELQQKIQVRGGEDRGELTTEMVYQESNVEKQACRDRVEKGTTDSWRCGLENMARFSEIMAEGGKIWARTCKIRVREINGVTVAIKTWRGPLTAIKNWRGTRTAIKIWRGPLTSLEIPGADLAARSKFLARSKKYGRGSGKYGRGGMRVGKIP